mgnify:FL=1
MEASAALTQVLRSNSYAISAGRVPGSVHESHLFFERDAWLVAGLKPVSSGMEREERVKRMGYLKRYSAVDENDMRKKRTCYWWRCFMAAAQRMMKKPIQSAAR